MAASRTLILLKGIGGVAATSLATLGGMEVGYKIQSTKTVGTAHRDDSSWDIEEMPEEYIEEVSDLGIPSGCDEKCDLTAEQLRHLKFEGKSGSSVIFDGLEGSDTFELTIEELEDKENYPWGKKYILKTKAITGTITIKNVKGDDIVLEENGEVVIREISGGGRLEKVPEEVNELGIPKRCEGEDSTKTCELTREQLQRLKFETRDDETSISIEGLKDKNTVELTIEKVTEDTANYPQGKKYTLKSKTGTVTIKGVKERDIVLEEENEGVVIRETSEGNKLETVEDSLGIPRRCAEKCELTKEELEKLKFETESGSSITVENLNDDDKVELKVETTTDLTNYPKGKKYTLKVNNVEATIKGVKGGEIVLDDENGEVVIRETSLGGRLEKAPEEVNELGIPKSCTTDSDSESCELTADQLQRFKFESKGNEAISVEGLTGNNKVTLEIEGKDNDLNYPKGKKYTITSSKDNVTIRNVKDGDIEIKTGGDVVIRETGRGRKLEKVPEEVDKLGIPNSCNSRSPCELTKEQLQKLKFETRSSSSITITGLEGNNTVELTVATVTGDKTNYPKGKKYTLKAKTGTVTIKGLKDGDIVLEAKQGVVVREKLSGGLLERAPEEVNELGIPTRCTSGSTCKLTRDQLKKIKFDPKTGSSIWITGMGINDKVDLKVEESNDTTNYPKNKKYSFRANKEEVTINGTKDWNIELEKDKDVLIRETGSGNKLETVDDSLGIPKSCNADQAKNNQPQTCDLTADQLKYLKLKDFGGKNANVAVNGLSDKIKLTISWVEDGGSYPGNIKYSFNNTNRNEDIRISRAGQTVTLEKKKESWFKNNGGLLELVVAKTRSEVKTDEANEILKKLGLEKLNLDKKDFNGNSDSTQHSQKKFDFYKTDDLKKIQFKVLGGGAETVDDLNHKKITVFFEYDSNTGKYPKNMKFTFENDQISPYVELKKNGKSPVQIHKKNTNTNNNNVKNRFKVENNQLVNVPN